MSSPERAPANEKCVALTPNHNRLLNASASAKLLFAYRLHVRPIITATFASISPGYDESSGPLGSDQHRIACGCIRCARVTDG